MRFENPKRMKEACTLVRRSRHKDGRTQRDRSACFLRGPGGT
jgi:hypothetical protein